MLQLPIKCEFRRFYFIFSFMSWVLIRYLCAVLKIAEVHSNSIRSKSFVKCWISWTKKWNFLKKPNDDKWKMPEGYRIKRIMAKNATKAWRDAQIVKIKRLLSAELISTRQSVKCISYLENHFLPFFISGDHFFLISINIHQKRNETIPKWKFSERSNRETNKFSCSTKKLCIYSTIFILQKDSMNAINEWMTFIYQKDFWFLRKT